MKYSTKGEGDRFTSRHHLCSTWILFEDHFSAAAVAVRHNSIALNETSDA